MTIHCHHLAPLLVAVAAVACLLFLLGEARWQPSPGVSWQIQFTGDLHTNLPGVTVYDIDLFDVAQSVVDDLHTRGYKVICYFSAGSYEDWRPDAAEFPQEVLGNPLDGWPGENWLDIRRLDVLGPIMSARLDLAATKGCDGVDPDNVDGYTNDSGFTLNATHQLTYNEWLANASHARELSIGLKNDLSQVEQLLPIFDWAINEQCFHYNECDLLLPFVAAGKPVLGIEYEGDAAKFCPRANTANFDVIKKKLELDVWRLPCSDFADSTSSSGSVCLCGYWLHLISLLAALAFLHHV